LICIRHFFHEETFICKIRSKITFPFKTVEPIDPIDPVAPLNVSRDIAVGWKILAWARQTLQEAEGHVTPCGTFRESNIPQIYSCYATAMSHIIDSEPSCYEEASSMERCHDGGVSVHHEE
jgi:hypothetical protein